MSQPQRPQQRNNRPRRELKNNQPRPDYQQQQPVPPDGYQQDGQPPLEGRPMPPRAPQAPYNQQLPPQQPSEPQKIYIQRESNNPVVSAILGILYVLAWPFIKIVQLVGDLVKLILEELVRSVVRFVLGVVLLVLVLVTIIGYAYALVQVDFNFVAAVPEMFRIFGSLVGLGG